VRDLVEVLPARAPLTMWATKATLQRLPLRAMPEDDDILSTVYGSGLQSRRASVRHQTACPVDRTVSGGCCRRRTESRGGSCLRLHRDKTGRGDELGLYS
jgi:hypothetical protein